MVIILYKPNTIVKTRAKLKTVLFMILNNKKNVFNVIQGIFF